MHETELIHLYLNGNIHSHTYVWNGDDVEEWTPIINVKRVYNNMKTQYVYGDQKSDKQQTREADTKNKKATVNETNASDDRANLMANIRNGIRLRNEEQSSRKQAASNAAPKRIKDDFPSASKVVITDAHRHTEHELPTLSSLSVDRERATRNTARKSNARQQAMFTLASNAEVSRKASLIRQRFGEVEVVSGSGKVRQVAEQTKSTNVNAAKRRQPARSRETAHRIARIKQRLDTLTDNESWMVSRIENVLFSDK